MSEMPLARWDSKTAMMPEERSPSAPGLPPAQPTQLRPALTQEGDEQRQAVEQGVQGPGGALGFVPEHPVHQQSCTERGQESPRTAQRCWHTFPVSFVPFIPPPSAAPGSGGCSWDRAGVPPSCSPSPCRNTMPSTMHRGWALNCRGLCQATPPR